MSLLAAVRFRDGTVTNEHESLPARPASTATYDDRDYYRRRIDVLVDGRLASIEGAITDLGKSHTRLDYRVDAIDSKLSRLFGALAVIIFFASIVGPFVVRWATGTH